MNPIDSSYGDDPSQFIRLHRPNSPTPQSFCVILIHGGFWKQTYGLNTTFGTAHESVIPDLLQNNFSIIEIEYRRYSNVTPFGYPETNNDVVTAIRYAFSQYSWMDPQCTALIGISAGGQLALCATLELYQLDLLPCLVVPIAPVADLEEAHRLRLSDEGDAVQNYMHGTPSEKVDDYRRASPMHRAAELARCPTGFIFVTGTADTDVPPAMVRAVHAAIAEERAVTRGVCRLVEVRGASHLDLFDAQKPAWPQVRGLVHDYLLAPPHVRKRR